jgi:hypothetical protein
MTIKGKVWIAGRQRRVQGKTLDRLFRSVAHKFGLATGYEARRVSASDWEVKVWRSDHDRRLLAIVDLTIEST